MKKNIKNNYRTSKYIVAMSVVLSALCIILTVIDIYSCLRNNLVAYCNSMEMYLEAMIDDGGYRADSFGKPIEEGLIDFIKTDYPTSASTYCFVGVNGELKFVKDENSTSKLDDKYIVDYFNIDEDTQTVDTAYGYTVNPVVDGERWFVSMYDINTDDRIVTVGICTNENFVIEGGNFDIMFQHIMLYMILFSIAFVVSTIFLSHKEKQNVKMEEEITNQLVENRMLIDRLGEKIELQANNDYNRDSGFCTRKVVEQVMMKLSPEQKNNTMKIYIKLETKEPHLIVRFSVLLERMRVGKSVCCLWEDDEFLVLMLNTDEENANNFVKQFLLQYQNMFQKDVRDTSITISKL